MSTANVDAVQLMLLQMRNTFLEDVPERLDRLEQLLMQMEEGGVDVDSFNEFYRITHSLKGSGGTFGLQIITTVCHRLEDLLNTTGGGNNFTPRLIAISLDYIDLLRLTLEQIKSGSSTFPIVEERLSELHDQLANKQFTVLLVDNSKLLTQMYLQALVELPVRTVVMTDGYSALMRVLTEPFDLLVTTNEVPLLNGVALIGALKLSDSNNRNIKTILITSNNNLTAHLNRGVDTDYVILKDARLAINLARIAKLALSANSNNETSY